MGAGEDIPRSADSGHHALIGHDPGGEPQTLGERIRRARARRPLDDQIGQRLGGLSSTIRGGSESQQTHQRVASIFEGYLQEE